MLADDFGPEEWSLMFSEARRVGLLGRLSSSLEFLEATPPARLRNHVLSSLVEVKAFQRDVLRELDHIELALADLATPVLLLKGLATSGWGLRPPEGVFSATSIFWLQKAVSGMRRLR